MLPRSGVIYLSLLYHRCNLRYHRCVPHMLAGPTCVPADAHGYCMAQEHVLLGRDRMGALRHSFFHLQPSRVPVKVSPAKSYVSQLVC